MKILTNQLLSFPLSGMSKRRNTQLVQKVPQFGKNNSMIKIEYLPKNLGKFMKLLSYSKNKNVSICWYPLHLPPTKMKIMKSISHVNVFTSFYKLLGKKIIKLLLMHHRKIWTRAIFLCQENVQCVNKIMIEPKITLSNL